MKKHLVSLKSLSLLLVFVVNIILSYPSVYAAASSADVGFSSLPASTQQEFKSILENLMKFLFESAPNHVITVKGDDGNTYKYDYNSAFDMLQAELDGNSDLVRAILSENSDVPDDVELYINSTAYNALPAGFQVLLKPLLSSAVDLHNNKSTVHHSSGDGRHGGSGHYSSVSAEDYNNAANSILNDIYVNSGIYSSVSSFIDFFNGVPRNSISFESDISISVFDNLGFNYTAFNSVNDVFWEYNINKNNYFGAGDYYTFYFIDNNDSLYTLNIPLYSSSENYHNIRTLYFNSRSVSAEAYQDKNSYLNFGLFLDNNNLYVVLASSNSDSLSYRYFQYIIGSPEFSAKPLLYDNYKQILNNSSSANYSLSNYSSDFTFYDCYNKTNVTDSFFENGIKSAGYIYSKNTQISNANLNVAATQIKDKGYTISGGNNSATADLIDWQKAIYILSQQYGISYEEMLKRVSIDFNDDGTVDITTEDNTSYNLDKLVTSFNSVFEKVEDISGELSDLLDYLKSLNIEGLQSYINSIEGTLDQLNQRDKDRQALYDNLSGKLDDISSLLSSLNLDSIGSIASDVSEIKEMIKEYSVAVDIDISESINKFKTPSSITTKFPFSLPFDIYNIFNIFSAEPQAPKFTIPFDFTSIGGDVYNINIDLSDYEWIANIIRWILYAIFIAGLVLLTNKLIGRG